MLSPSRRNLESQERKMSAVTQLKPTEAKPKLSDIANKIGPEIASRSASSDEAGQFVSQNYALLKQNGLVEAGVPAELGGGDASIDDLAQMLRTLAQYCGSTALAFAMHQQQVAIPAWRWRHQKFAGAEPLLKRIAAEKIIVLTSGGSDWIAGSGKAEKVEGGFKITARKSFASGAEAGALLMTSAVLEEEGGVRSVLHFGVPMNSPHVRIDPVWNTMGMRGTGSNDVVIDGHVVPETAVALKRKAGEWHPLFHIIGTIAIPLIYSVYVGVAERARDIAVSMAAKRRADPNITQLIGQMDTELRGAKVAHEYMLSVVRRNAPSAETINDAMMGRQLLARHAIRAVELAMEAAGGASYFKRHELERCFRDVQGARFHPMQTVQQANYAGAMALGLPDDRIF
jgi:alkylation response protein AidB-like acyl-CoA dehydrogenase